MIPADWTYPVDWTYDLTPAEMEAFVTILRLGIAVEQTRITNDDGTVTHRYDFTPGTP